MRSWPSALLERLRPRAAATPARMRVAFLIGQGFAHRGLHGARVPENSRAAFAAAVTAGEGIELDVRASGDGEAFVFHDADLARMTGLSGPIAARSAKAIDGIRLAGTAETIPSLYSALGVVLGRVPVLIEVKADGRVGTLCRAIRHALEGYRGPVAVMSFNPEVGRWFATHAERIPRGLVLSEGEARGWRARIGRWRAIRRARAEFLACDVRDLPGGTAARARRIGLPVLAWTVRTPAERAVAQAHADGAIFERPA